MNKPIFATLLADKWNREDRAVGLKPTALGTPMRYSSAHGCSRQMAYAAIAEPTEEWDTASSWVTRLGTLIHEQLQAAIAEQYPTAQFEVASKCGDYISGSADGYIPSEYGEGVVLEIKTVGNYVWAQQTGLGQFKRSEPKGPKEAAIVQAGMNALGIGGVEHLCLITLAKECVSVSKAEKMELAEWERYAAEWWYARDEWEPMALAEINRMTNIAEELIHGDVLVSPEVVDDGYQTKQITAGSYWTCDYCAYRTVCVQDGPAPIKVSISNLNRKGEQ